MNGHDHLMAPATSMSNIANDKAEEKGDQIDFDLPQNWPLHRKVYVSVAASGYTFALLYGATSYTAGIQGVMTEFNVSMTRAIVPFSLYIWGIFFAPLYSPHVSEVIGRAPQYMINTLGLAVFTLGAAYSQTFTALGVCRFFAGLMGGSNAVLIEGTFADVWPALYTSSYYPFLMSAQYFGAATGAIVCWHVVPATSWRYTQYTTLMFALAALLLGLGMPETYLRKVIRVRAKRLGLADNLEPAPTGTTFSAIFKITITDPLIMLATQPIVTMISLYLALNFGVLFCWFVLVPAVLQGVAKYTAPQVGSAFATAIGGTAMAVVSSVIIDQLSVRFLLRKASRSGGTNHMVEIEHRLIPVMVGSALLMASLFWIGWTAVPTVSPYVPVVGNGIYVWGSGMTLIGFVSYLFDAYPPQGTLSALTAAACSRLFLAGTIPLVIITAVTNINGGWALSAFGFIATAFLAFPFVIYFFGKKLRMMGSPRFGDNTSMNMSPLRMEVEGMMRKDGGSA